MRPAIPTQRHAALLAMGILIPALAPCLIPARALPDKRESYSAIGWGLGPFGWIEHQIFDEQTPIDILFAGSSHLWCAIDAPQVQAALEEHRRGPAVVRMLGWPRAGYDALYFIVKDMLDRRPVKVLVIYDEHFENGDVHPAAHRWYRYADEPSAIDGLPWKDSAALYAASVLGMPRNLLSLVRHNRQVDPSPISLNYWQSAYRADNPADRLGSLAARLNYNYEPNYTDYAPPSPATQAQIYSPATAARFAFTGEATPAYKRVFLERLVAMVAQHGTKLVFMDTPDFDERRNPQITERLCWPRILPGKVWLMGIPPGELFASLSDESVSRLYYDQSHFNESGQRYFTAIVDPALFRVLDE
jgi:hypothetical protein